MLDAGGARMRNRNRDPRFLDAFNRGMIEESTLQPEPPKPESTVRVRTFETHDGVQCDCEGANGEFDLKIGDQVELEHVCHDGRVDKVVAEIVGITAVASVEHGKVRGPAT